MKQSIFFFSAVTFSMLLFFSSCSKEQIEDVSVSAIDNQSTDEVFFRSAVGINMGPLTLTTRFGEEDCVMSYGICIDLDPIYAPDMELAENQAMYVAYANEQGELVLRLDGSSLSESFTQSIMGDPFFRLANDIIIAEEIVVGAFEASGQVSPPGPMTLLAGEYEVVFNGEEFTTTVNTPVGGIIIIIDDIFA